MTGVAPGGTSLPPNLKVRALSSVIESMLIEGGAATVGGAAVSLAAAGSVAVVEVCADSGGCWTDTG